MAIAIGVICILFSLGVSFRLIAQGKDIFKFDILNGMMLFLAFICGMAGTALILGNLR